MNELELDYKAKFIEWYNAQSISSIDDTSPKGLYFWLLSKNFDAIGSLYDEGGNLKLTSGLIKDAFLKKIALCENVIFNMLNKKVVYNKLNENEIHKMYDDIFYFIMHNYKIYTTPLPSILDDLRNVIKVDSYIFDSVENLENKLNELTENGEIAIYNFYIESSGEIIIRYCPVNVKNIII